MGSGTGPTLVEHRDQLAGRRQGRDGLDPARRGRLIAVLTEFTTSTFPIAAIYPHREAMPLKVRLFIDMLAKHLRALPAFRDAPTGSKPQPILLPA